MNQEEVTMMMMMIVMMMIMNLELSIITSRSETKAPRIEMIDYEMLVVESILHHWVDIADAGTLGIAVDPLAGEFGPGG